MFQDWLPRLLPMLFMSHRVQHWSIEWNRSAYVWETLEHHLQSQRMRCYSGTCTNWVSTVSQRAMLSNEASENASISGTISHRCDNQLRTLCALYRAIVVMSVYKHGHRWLLVWEVDVVASKSGWLLRFPLSHFCLHWNEDNKLIAFQVGSALITADLTVARSDTVFSAW